MASSSSSERLRSRPMASRRAFLRRLAAVGGAAVVPSIISSAALGRDGAAPPSDRLGLGVIGAGGKARGGMATFMALKDVQAIAIAEPNDKRREQALVAARLKPQDGCRDFREMVVLPNVDVVLVGTPDHWHVLQSIAAAKAGKHVYCEKPLSNTIREGRALVEAVKRYGVVFQHGTQLKSSGGTRLACELVRNGRIGRLKSVRIGSPPGAATGVHPPQPVPDWLDYDMWLGPAPWRPYAPPVVNNCGWYFVSDFSKSGWVAGFGVHDIDIAQWGLGLERTGPVEIEGTGVFPKDGLYDTVLTYRLEFRYANGAVITMTDTGQNRHGVLFEGTEGTVYTRGGIECKPSSLAYERFGANEVHLYQSSNHEANLIECIKTRRETITPAEIAHRSCSTCLLGGIALQLGRRLRWDPAAERFPDNPDANRLLSYAMRSPWTL
ncbi:MAG: Gfo/Idh/MocA family oxidoreductase [Planctomycetes bacterium]|nr:Gfo/Idh/MocA family oxidoreductase [Planctomycetota bacterium]